MELLIGFILGLATGAYTFNSKVRKQVNIYARKASTYLSKPEKARSKVKGKAKTSSKNKTYKGSEH